MSYTLFLDDEREPQWFLDNVQIVRNEAEFVDAILLLGVPDVISFDHDLGGSETGLRCLWVAIELHLDEKIDLNKVAQVIVHSHNPVGAQNIAGTWNSFCASEMDSDVQAEVKPWQQRPTFLVR